MEPLAEQFLQFLEKDIRDWEDAAAFFDKIRTVAMDAQIYSGQDFAERYRASGRVSRCGSLSRRLRHDSIAIDVESVTTPHPFQG